MAKVYFLRHQAHGIVHEYPFVASPSDEQQAAVRQFCFNMHGFSHAKTPSEPYWMRVIEVEVLGPKDAPDVPKRDLSVVSEHGAGETSIPGRTIHGTGVVDPR